MGEAMEEIEEAEFWKCGRLQREGRSDNLDYSTVI